MLWRMCRRVLNSYGHLIVALIILLQFGCQPSMKDGERLGLDFIYFTVSNMHRNSSTSQMTLAAELNATADPDGYREVPDITKDDEGRDFAPVTNLVRPTVECGKEQSTVYERIVDCAAKNPTASTWDGS